MSSSRWSISSSDSTGYGIEWGRASFLSRGSGLAEGGGGAPSAGGAAIPSRGVESGETSSCA